MATRLPAAVERATEAMAKVVSHQDDCRTVRMTFFVYDDGEKEHSLGLFYGDIPIPAVGQTVSLWEQGHRLGVARVHTSYGLQEADGEKWPQVVSVTVFVEPLEDQ